jgi:GT2 family glycosyltransferase
MSKLGYGFDHDYLFPYEHERARVADVIFPTAAAMLMRKGDFKSCGGFDRAFFMYHEDVDLGWRLWLLGKRVVVCSDSIVYHLFGGTTKSVRGLKWRANLGMRHNVRSLIKNYELVNLLIALKGVLGIWVRHRNLAQAVHVVGWNLLHLPGTLAKRWWVQSRRVRADQELFRRGLISQFKFPPPSPERPRAEPHRATEEWILSPVLLPGQHSSLGRLGYGWYVRELHSDGWIRWTCGHASCFLRVGPDKAGSVSIDVHIPPEADVDRTIVIECNGEKASHTLQTSGWETISLPVKSDSSGVLEVHILSPEWIPHNRIFYNWDFRRLGCRVKEVRFEPEQKKEKVNYRTVSVIIPTFNRWTILEETLKALTRQTWQDIEVIVVDDGSNDGTWERLKQWQKAHQEKLDLKVFHQQNLKPGQARNHGLRYATGDIVIFIGDDTIPDADFIESHIAKHNEIGMVCAVLGFTDWHRERMLVTPFLEFVNTDGAQFGYGHFQNGGDVPFTCFYTSNISIPREVLREEPFHPAFNFVNWEDVELGYRLSLQGLRIIYNREAKSRHLHPMNMANFVRRQKQIGEKMRVILDLHPELEGSDSMPPTKPTRRIYLSCLAARILLPVFNFLDKRKVSLPVRIYRAVNYSGLFAGIRQSQANPQK